MGVPTIHQAAIDADEGRGAGQAGQETCGLADVDAAPPVGPRQVVDHLGSERRESVRRGIE